jgi:hypothetical protein
LIRVPHFNDGVRNRSNTGTFGFGNVGFALAARPESAMKFAPIAFALALAACSGGEPDPQETASSDPELVAPGATLTPTPSPTLEPSAGPAVTEIPASLRGRWGLVPADCTSTRGDAKGLLTIGATELRFYESVGTMTSASSPDANRLRGTFAFKGEGMAWTRDVALVASKGAKSLDFSDSGNDSPPTRRTYTKCS